ncbi:zinc finger, CCHC-type containing protein [Tanacetum coccineum]
MGYENPIHTLGDYSKPSHKVYRNTIELPIGNNVVPLRFDIIRLVQNGCSFHGRTRKALCVYFNFPFAIKLEIGLNIFQQDPSPQGDSTTLFPSWLQIFPPGRTAKLRNDILMFQQHHGESFSEAWTHFKDLLQKLPHYGIDLWLQV